MYLHNYIIAVRMETQHVYSIHTSHLHLWGWEQHWSKKKSNRYGVWWWNKATVITSSCSSICMLYSCPQCLLRCQRATKLHMYRIIVVDSTNISAKVMAGRFPVGAHRQLRAHVQETPRSNIETISLIDTLFHSLTYKGKNTKYYTQELMVTANSCPHLYRSQWFSWRNVPATTS